MLRCKLSIALVGGEAFCVFVLEPKVDNSLSAWDLDEERIRCPDASVTGGGGGKAVAAGRRAW